MYLTMNERHSVIERLRKFCSYSDILFIVANILTSLYIEQIERKDNRHEN